jgi:N-acetylglucosaminyldiphosphoundecaprenol N-acetyl-beta-D-mannosaminyltransferase
MTSERSTVAILGVRIDRLCSAEALEALGRFATDGGSHHVVTVNPEFIMAARRNPEFMETLREADLALPDGIGVVWASRLLQRPVAGRITGVDTVRALARFAAERHLRPFLLGAAEGVAEAAARELRRANPALEIAGVYAGSPRPEDEDAIVTLIRAVRPDMLFVAYGAPQQDLWIARTRRRLGVPLAMGVGGTLDFIAGKRRRAPRCMQRLGIEWLYRLLQEPRRWRRMLALPRFAALVIWSALTRREE